MPSLNISKSLAGLAAAALVSTGTAAMAQSKTAPSKVTAPKAQERTPATLDDRFLILGLGGSFEPVFPGARKTKVSPDPIVQARFGRFFIGKRGFGADFVVADGPVEITVGTAIGLFEGRKEADDKAFAGLGNLNRAGEVSVFAQAEWGAVEFDAAVVTIVGSGAGRTYVELGAGFENELTDRLSYEVKVSTIFGNQAYTRSLFGVSAVQSARSGYNTFTPGAGFTQASVDFSMRYAITENWFAQAGVGVGTLLGDARKSPFLPKDTFTSTSIGIGRVFRF